MKKICTYYIMALSICILSCERQEVMNAGGEMVRFSMDTRAGLHTGTETTYRIMAYDRDTEIPANNYKYFGDRRPGTSYGYGTGTYYLAEGNTELTPCLVDDDGVYLPDQTGAEDAAIRGTLGDVWLSYISDAVKNNEDGTFDFDPDKPFFCSPAKEAVIDGYGTVDLNGDGVMIKDIRAKVVINFYQKTSTSFTITSTDDEGSTAAFIKGTGDDGASVNYHPAKATIKVTGENKGRVCKIENADGSEDAGKGKWLYKTERIVPAVEYGHELLLNYTLTQGTRSTDLSVLLSSDERTTKLEPMLVYTFNIITLSGYIYVNLDIHRPDPAAGTDNWYDVPVGGDVGAITQDKTIAVFEIVEDADGKWVVRELTDNLPIGGYPSE